MNTIFKPHAEIFCFFNEQAQRFDNKCIQLSAREQEVEVLKSALSQNDVESRLEKASNNIRRTVDAGNSVPLYAQTTAQMPLQTYARRTVQSTQKNPMQLSNRLPGPKRFMTPSQRKALNSSGNVSTNISSHFYMS